VTSQGRFVGTTTLEGWLAVPVNADEIQLEHLSCQTKVVRLRGPHTDVAMTPIRNDPIPAVRIVIDAANGGRDPGIISATGARSCDYALDVARRLGKVLEEAGASVRLSRDGDLEVPEPSRVSYAEDHNADLVVSVSFGSQSRTAKPLDDSGYRRDDLTSYVGYYPQSAKGRALAKAIAERMPGAAATPLVGYLIQQTGCTAVLVQPASIADPEAERRFARADERSKAAHQIFEGIAAYLRAPAEK
jgi:N-acetylmuramoyl-L-alanine amidase